MKWMGDPGSERKTSSPNDLGPNESPPAIGRTCTCRRRGGPEVSAVQAMHWGARAGRRDGCQQRGAGPSLSSPSGPHIPAPLEVSRPAPIYAARSLGEPHGSGSPFSRATALHQDSARLGVQQQETPVLRPHAASPWAPRRAIGAEGSGVGKSRVARRLGRGGALTMRTLAAFSSWAITSGGPSAVAIMVSLQ